MKKNIPKFFVLNCVILLLSCSCRNNNSQSENYEIKDGYKKHEIIFENKRISFVIPEHYSDTYKPDRILDMYPGCDKRLMFYSPKNDNNSLGFIIFENDYDESTIDSFIVRDIKESVYMEIPVVPFYEERNDKNGHKYYLCMSSCVDFIREESHLPKEEQYCVYSHFHYITCFGKKIYVYTLDTREPIKDFSYEEKKYIIESVRIEEIK